MDETEDVSSSWPESSVENVTSRRNSNSYVLEKRSAAASSSLIFVKLYLSRAAAAECQHKPSDLSEFCQKKAQPRVTSFQSKSWIGVKKKNRNNIHSKIRPAEFGATVQTVTVWQDILQQ